ncbi:MAG: Co(2+)/Mg(2+) efflux protein ApaG [Roseimicrobium sp.]
MSLHFEEHLGLSVSVDQVVYLPTLQAPPERPHPFAYYLSIHNASEEPVTILGRKWIVRDDAGTTIVVEGDGVIGQTPRLEPGQTFSYNSYHVIGAGSTATGTFFGQTDHGKPVLVRVPDFRMELPSE